jgi:hypothetical protein
MRLTAEDLKAGLLHPRRAVRNVVVKHFGESFTNDPDVTRQAILGIEQFGWQRFLTWEHMFCELPLSDEASFEWVCHQVERSDDGAPSNNQKGHLTTMLSKGEITFVDRHQSRLLAINELSTKDRETIVARLNHAQLDPDECWRRLEAHCAVAHAAKTFADARMHEAELLLEPLVRAGDRFATNVLEVLRRPVPPPDGDGPDGWLIGMAITLAGHLRLEEAAPLLWGFWEVDWDWYSEEVTDALTRIGTPSVVQLAQERYPNADWSVRNFAHNLFENIRCEEAVAAIALMLDGEDDDNLRGQLGIAAAAQFDDRLVPLALEVFQEAPDDPERGAIRENLVAFSYLSGWELPERDEWECEIDEEDDRIRQFSDPTSGALTKFLVELVEGSAKASVGAFDNDGDDAEADDLFLDAPVQQAPHAGRNDPCPCGSGKKYKKCCLRTAPD